MKTFIKNILPPVLVAAIFIGLWYLVSLLIIPDRVGFLLPTPHKVLQEGVLEWDQFKPTLEGLWETAQVALLGFALATLIGVSIAILMSQARWIERTLFPYAVILQAIPIVAVVPLIGLWAGYEFKSKVIVTIIIATFPIITNTLFGLRSVSPEMYDLFKLHTEPKTFRTRRLQFSKLQFQTAIPSIFTGLRISAGLAVVGTIVGEFFFRSGTAMGLGRLIAESYKPHVGKGPELYTAIIITCAFGVALFVMMNLAAKYFTRHLREVEA